MNRKRELHTSKQTESRLKIILQYSAVLLTLLVGMFYYFGYLYLSQWLDFWGLTPNMFPFSKEEIIIAGGEQLTLAFVNILVDSSPSASGVFLLFVVVFIVSTFRKLRAMFKDQLYSRIRRIHCLRPYIEITDNHDKAMTFMSYGCLALFFVIVLLLAVASLSNRVITRAQEDSKKVRESILAKTPTVPKAVLVLKKDAKEYEKHSGYLIQTSGSHCVVFNRDKGTIVFPLANVARMEIEDKQNMR